MTVLGLTDAVSAPIMGAAQLLAISFLVFHSITPNRHRAVDVLAGREAFAPFPSLLPHARDLRIYGPTAINVVVHLAEIRRLVLARGGMVRIVVQKPDPIQLRHTAVQLDQGLDLDQTLTAAIRSLERCDGLPGFGYRLLPFNPGFSLVVVNAGDKDGYVIVEPHGFGDQAISDRMHLRITRSESPRWFAYWVDRFDAIWAASSDGEHASSGAKPGTDGETRSEGRLGSLSQPDAEQGVAG
ncbi:hypothetical protein [Catenulispora acidiphila]|nr:hypothetical protein [Catenulispora acidiphila]